MKKNTLLKEFCYKCRPPAVSLSETEVKFVLCLKSLYLKLKTQSLFCLNGFVRSEQCAGLNCVTLPHITAEYERAFYLKVRLNCLHFIHVRMNVMLYECISWVNLILKMFSLPHSTLDFLIKGKTKRAAALYFVVSYTYRASYIWPIKIIYKGIKKRKGKKKQLSMIQLFVFLVTVNSGGVSIKCD